MKILSVVCARAGSKGLRNKCIALIGGKMVIEYSIDYSLSLGNEVKTVVSTDIPEILDICRKRSIVYIERDGSLCSDGCTIDHVLVDAIEREGRECSYCSVVYGNVPTRYPQIFREALDFLESNRDFDAAISMQNVEKFNPGWMFDYDSSVLPRKLSVGSRRQDLPQLMIHDAHTLLFRSDLFYGRYKGSISYESKYMYSIYGSRIKPVINNKFIIDIDTEKDIKYARLLFNAESRNKESL